MPRETAAVSAPSVYTINHAPCHFMQSHIRKVHACLAVTCHLHFWQNDRGLLRATAVTRGWNGYRNKSHRTLTPEKKIFPPPLQGFEPATFLSRFPCLYTHLSVPTHFPCACPCLPVFRVYIVPCLPIFRVPVRVYTFFVFILFRVYPFSVCLYVSTRFSCLYCSVSTHFPCACLPVFRVYTFPCLHVFRVYTCPCLPVFRVYTFPCLPVFRVYTFPGLPVFCGCTFL